MSPPQGGNFQCNPGNGYEYKTDITVTLKNWQSYHYPLNVKLFGEYLAEQTLEIDDQTEVFEVPINRKVIYENEIWQETKLLRTMHRLKAVLTDNVGEYTEVRISCNITKAPLTWQERIDLAFSQERVEDKFHDLKMVVNEYNLQAIMNNEGS